MINLLAVDGPERLVIVVVWLVESSNPQQFVTRSELEVHERKKIFGEYLFIREFMKTCSSGDQLAHEVDSERGGVVSAVMAGARHGGGRLFEAVDSDNAAREGQSNQGEGDQSKADLRRCRV
jgi:hypothetical protein